MKQLRWKDFSLVSKIVIEVGMIAVLLFAMNMLFYVRINNSMQKMDNVYASNAELTELSQVFEKVQDNMYKYLKVKNSQTLLDYYQNEAKYRNELEKLNEDNINDPVKLLERNIRKMSETYLDCTAETVAAKRGRNVEQYKRKYDDATKLYRYIQSSIDELNNDCGIIRCGREFFDALSPEDIIAYREEPYSYCVFIKNRQSLRKAFCDISIENASIEDMMLFYSKGEKII